VVGPDGKSRRVDARAPDIRAGSSTLRATFVRHGTRTTLDRVYETGAIRLRQPRGDDCEAVLVNTGGGVIGGDHVRLDVTVGDGAALIVTSAAAEKIYGSAESVSEIDTTLRIAAGGDLSWLPQETILFDGARLARRFEIDMAADAQLVAAEILVFGRLAKGEIAISGALRDQWRVRRGHCLVYADQTCLDGAIGAILDRPAVAGGARASALLLVVAPDAERHIEPLRAGFELFPGSVEAGTSVRDGVLVARLLSRNPDHLRQATMAALATIRGRSAPRSWS
jgi:urease accessory protein